MVGGQENGVKESSIVTGGVLRRIVFGGIWRIRCDLGGGWVWVWKPGWGGEGARCGRPGGGYWWTQTRVASDLVVRSQAPEPFHSGNAQLKSHWASSMVRFTQPRLMGEPKLLCQ